MKRAPAALALALASLAFAPSALADDRGHKGRSWRYESPIVTDHLGRPVDPRYLENERFDRGRGGWREDRHGGWRSDDDDDDDRHDDRRYGKGRDQDDWRYNRGYSRYEDRDRRVIVVGGFFSPDLAYAYSDRLAGRYVRYSDCRERWDRPYFVGQPLPRGVAYGHPAYRYLPPAPYGHSYVSVGPDVLLVSPEGLIVDALVRIAKR